LVISTLTGFLKTFDTDQASNVRIFDLLQIEKSLSEKILPFTELERVSSKSGKYQKLDEKNIEMLKSLGYIE